MSISVGGWNPNLALVGNILVWKDEDFKGWIGRAFSCKRHDA